jgi:hypothetical protein
MDAAVGILDADNRGRLRKVRQRQHGQCEKGSMRQVRCRDLLRRAARPQEKGTTSGLRRIEEDSIKLGKQPAQLLIECLKALGRLIAQRILHGGEVLAFWA